MDLDGSKKFALIIFLCKLLPFKQRHIPMGAVVHLQDGIWMYDGTKWIEL
jgi:hypothetical protein